ncbi:glycine oxidase ThiO [uncultured Arsenicicoccus sp.]|uniref:glycine oxidase ThiO n=1 Tax=uncultured Arsenicicoccus sp. TaxID=491339 RepID=UPI00259902CB|nr:glycine oxidase ThiO [uncultured Arsenicicoccus sp.]
MSSPGPRVVVLGGGVVGLACAWSLARRGADVELWDPAPGQGASHAAGGMLAPVSEATYEEEDLLALALASHARWPDFAARLEAGSDISPDLHTEGALHVGMDLDDAREVWRTADLLERYSLPYQRLSSRELRWVAPALAPGARTALLVESDLWVDNRFVVQGLLAASARAGVELVPRRGGLVLEDGRVVGVTSCDHGPPLESRCDTVVLASGVDSGGVPGVAELVHLPLRPVKGQILRMSGARGLLGHTVRGTVHGDHVYLIPRATGELVIGATSEELGDTQVTGRGLLELLRAATTLLPEVGELTLVDAVARLRPGTPDNGPLLGRVGTPGLVVATGHFRHGMLLAPVTADLVTELVLDGATDIAEAAPFAATRYTPTPLPLSPPTPQ